MALTRYEMKGGTDFTVPEYDGAVPEGMVFTHYTTQPDGTGLSYKPGDVMRVHGNIRLYPHFRRELD